MSGVEDCWQTLGLCKPCFILTNHPVLYLIYTQKMRKARPSARLRMCPHLDESGGLVELRKDICRTRLPIWQESVNTVPEDGESQDSPVIA